MRSNDDPERWAVAGIRGPGSIGTKYPGGRLDGCQSLLTRRFSSRALRRTKLLTSTTAYSQSRALPSRSCSPAQCGFRSSLGRRSGSEDAQAVRRQALGLKLLLNEAEDRRANWHRVGLADVRNEGRVKLTRFGGHLNTRAHRC